MEERELAIWKGICDALCKPIQNKRLWKPECITCDRYDHMEIKYNIWHIDAYTGYNDFHRNTYSPTPLNHHIDFIANATVTKWDIYDMFYEKYRSSRVVVIDKCYIVASGVVTYEHKESLK